MTRYVDYHIVRGDTLESIALATLGDAGRWRLLAALNRLRYPFISDDQIQQYGSPLDTIVTSAGISIGATTYTLPLPVTANEWLKGNVFYIQKVAADGSILYDALTLSVDVDSATGVLTFATAAANAYLAGTAAFLFIKPGELMTRVLRTGEALHIPSTTPGVVISTGDDAFLSLLGMDLQLDDSGQVVFNTDGDLSLVSGISNLIQALRLRLNTPTGVVPYAPEYGNQAYDHVGEMGSPYFYNLIGALVSRAIVADPRISAVTDVTVRQFGAKVLVDATVQVRSGASLLRLQNLALGLSR